MRSITSILRISRVLAAAILLAVPPVPVQAGLKNAPAAINKERPGGNLKLPMYFEANRGQTDASVKFFTRAAGYNLYLTGSEAVTVLPGTAADKTKGSVAVRMKLKGANSNPAVRGLNILPGRTSYFFGNDSSKWQTGVEQYAKVKFGQVYPGIDMVYRFEQGHVEYDFIVAPGANPGRILMGFEGGKGLRLDSRGNLVLSVDGGELTYKAPKLYQRLGGRQVPVKGRFVLASNKNVRFEVGNYIKSKELVIDPQLVYSTYLGGKDHDNINSIAVDKDGAAYVTGWSISIPDDFPPTTPAGGHTIAYPAFVDPAVANNGGRDVFVAKISTDGTKLLWLAWLGGALDDEAKGIALDQPTSSTPNVFITGQTASAGFPVSGPQQVCTTISGGGTLAFVAELQQPGDVPSLVYSTCWGDSGVTSNIGNAIAVEAGGAAYVAGTTSGDALFPIIGPAPGVAPYGTSNGMSEAGFVMKIAAGGSPVNYSMFLGPQSETLSANAIAVDTAGHAWVAGRTASYTLCSAPNTACAGHFAETKTAGTESDVFVAEVNTGGTGLDYKTYINGNLDEEATAIKLNNGGAPPYHVFVAGWTVSSTNFPSTAYLLLPTEGPGSRPAVYQKDLPPGAADAPFILRLDPLAAGGGTQEMVYATHLGATGADRALTLALDDLDDAYISGWTLSSDWVISTTPPDPLVTGPGALNATPGKLMGNTCAGQTAFVAAIGPTGQYQPFFTYLGASIPGHTATGLAIDAAHNIYVAGYTRGADFPLMTGSLRTVLNNTGTETWYDGFITKISPVLSFGAPPPPGCTITGLNPDSGFTAGGTTVTITGTGFSGLFGAASVTFDGINASTYTVNASSTVITAVAPAHPLGSVPLRVTTIAGICSAAYNYVLSPVCGGADYFFPSPAAGATGQFAYCMALPGTIKIRVYNVIGDLVAKIEDNRAAGAQLSPLNTARLASGVYLYRLEKNYGGGNSVRSGVEKFVVQH